MIKLEIEATDADHLRQQLAALLSTGVYTIQTDVIAQTVTLPLAEPAKRGTKPKDDAPKATPLSESPASTQASGAQPPSTTGPTATSDASPSEPAGPVAYDTHIKPAVLKVSGHPVDQGGGREGVLKLMEQFGVANAKEIPEDRWPELLAAVDTILGVA